MEDRERTNLGYLAPTLRDTAPPIMQRDTHTCTNTHIYINIYTYTGAHTVRFCGRVGRETVSRKNPRKFACRAVTTDQNGLTRTL